MCDYKRWDAIVAGLSSDEEEEKETRPIPNKQQAEAAGIGHALTEDGRVAATNRPGNARGNALSTNAHHDPTSDRLIDKFSWVNDSPERGYVLLTVPLAPLGHIKPETVRCTFRANALELTVTAGDAGARYRLRITAMPGAGIVPEACSQRVGPSSDAPLRRGGAIAGAQPGSPCTDAVLIVLRKRDPGEQWTNIGVPERREPQRPTITLSDYNWSDERTRVTVWVKAPGVHLLPPERVRVRFRELSFDVAIEDLSGRDASFAVTELPMEVVASACTYAVETDRVKVVLSKWAKTSWFKLQCHR